MTTRTGTGDAAVNTVTVLRSGQATTTTTITGFIASATVVGADGTVAITTRTGTGDAAVNTVTVLR
jgi:hypothetical protein